jgi:hypothetical protein
MTSGVVMMRFDGTVAGQTFDIDGIQLEQQIAGLAEPSPWKPPGLTQITGNIIRTGEIRSNLTTTVNGTPMPNWSINMAGNMQVGDGLIRGKLLVGLSGDPDAGNSYISSGNFVTGSTGWKIDSAGNAELNDGTFRGTIDAVNFIGQSVISSGSLIAGNPLTNHAAVASTGLYVYTNTPYEGIVETLRLGVGTDDYFAVTDALGNVNASIDSAGSASFTSLNVTERVLGVDGQPEKGLFIYGTEFEDWLGNQQNVVAWVKSFGSGAAVGNVETPYLQLEATLKANRMYAFEILYPVIYITNTGGGRMLMSLRVETGGSQAQLSSNRYIYHRVAIPVSATATTVPSGFWYENGFSTDREISMLLSYQTETGTGYIQQAILLVRDLGPTIPETGLDRRTTPPTPTKKTYTSTWVASHSEAYNGSNTVRYNTDDLVQGDSGSSNGNSHALILFRNANSTGGQTNVSVATAMTGATINKVEVYLYANHWYAGSGGTAIVRSSNATGLSGWTPSGTAKTVSSWARSSGKWVDITSISSTSNIGAVTIGKAPSSSTLYYGRFNAHNASSNKPQLRITYTK